MPTFFHSVQDFNAVNYLWMTLKSPMILMALGAWVLTSLLPKLTVSHSDALIFQKNFIADGRYHPSAGESCRHLWSRKS